MNSPAINFPAVRAFLRAILPSARLQAEAAHADAQFDGGEWSAPWHDLAWEREQERVADAIAPRFGLSGLALLDQVAEASEVEFRRELQVICAERRARARRLLPPAEQARQL